MTEYLAGGARTKLQEIVLEAENLIKARTGKGLYEHGLSTLDGVSKTTGPHFRVHMPYCFKRLQCDRWLQLNRNYKLLGMTGRAFIDYDKFSDAALTFECDPHDIPGVWHITKHADRLYLYNDDPKSRRNYFGRLGRLLDHAEPFDLAAARLCAAVAGFDGPGGIQ